MFFWQGCQVLFDFTRLGLSGAYDESELAQPGRGSGRKKQLQIGLNTLADSGLPVLSRVHAGNANHTVDVPENLAALQERLKGRELVVTTDSAGLCHENIIAYNTGDGVWVQDTAGIDNAVLSNSIHSNGGLGIDVVGVNPGHTTILDLPVYPDLADVPGKVDIVGIFRRSESVEPIVHLR